MDALDKVWWRCVPLHREPVRHTACRLLGAVATSELVDLTCGIHDFLLAGVERMACGTYFDAQISSCCGTGLERVSAAASDLNLVVLGMDFRFHSFLPVIKFGNGY